MNKRNSVQLVLALVLLVSLGSGVFVEAQVASPPAGSTFEQRLAQRKSEQKISLEEKDATRLSKRCSNAKTTINGLQQKLSETVSNRRKTYETIDAKLWVGIGQHKLAGQDTFALEKQQAIYRQQIDKFNVLSAEYLQTIDDIVVLNCQTDVIGFKALLETSRSYLTQIRAHNEVMRVHVVNNIKPELSNLGQKL